MSAAQDASTAAQVVSELPIMRRVEGHREEVPFFVTAEMFGGLPLEIAGGELGDKVGIPVATPHTHELAEIYLLISPSPGGAVIDVEVEGGTFEVVSPAAVYIPARATHRFVTRRAEVGSYCLGVLIAGDVTTSMSMRGTA
jgi:hypothetical protein